MIFHFHILFLLCFFRKATFYNNDQRIECKMGSAPPIWVPDRRVSMCQKCAVEFTVLIRRHHCRACGQVVCSNCSANKAPLRYLEFDSARVCDTCFDILEKGKLWCLEYHFVSFYWVLKDRVWLHTRKYGFSLTWHKVAGFLEHFKCHRLKSSIDHITRVKDFSQYFLVWYLSQFYIKIWYLSIN